MLLHSIYTPLAVLPILEYKLLETLKKENFVSVHKWHFLRRCNFYEKNTNFQIFHSSESLNSKKFIVELSIQAISQSGDDPTLFVEIRNNSKKPLKNLLLLIGSDQDLDREAQKIIINILPILKSVCDLAYVSNVEDKDIPVRENNLASD